MTVKETEKKPRRVGDGTPGPGRPKGIPNKSTMAVKQALELAFEGLGGVPKLQAWAADNQTEFYKLWVRMLPTDVKAEVAVETMNLSGEVANLPKPKRDAIRAAIKAAVEGA